jgi:cell division control protein 45
MYLPREQLGQLYEHLQRNIHPLSPPVLVVTSLGVDSLCATRILTSLMKRDYILHNIQPVAGYTELQAVGQKFVLPMTRQHGGDGGTVVCLGAGGLVDLEEVLGLDGQSVEEGAEPMDMTDHGVEVWVIDGRRPWNLSNVFGSSTTVQQAEEGAVLLKKPGVDQGRVLPHYIPGKGGIIVWDDGDIQSELSAEREAYAALQDMPEITEEDLDIEQGETDDETDENELSSSQSRKRKAASHESDEDSETDDYDRPRQRRRSNSSMPIPSSPGGNPYSNQSIAATPPTSSQPHSPNGILPSSPPKAPSGRQLRRKLLKLRRKHEATLQAYYSLGTSSSEPVSGMLYSLASELGREDNDLLWLAIVGISSVELSPFANAKSARSESGRRVLDKSEQMREVLRDEVRRLNPIPEEEIRRSQSGDIIPTKARSPTDCSIRLSPEPRFLLIRHWSLYDSMLYSPYLSTRLHMWSDVGRKRLHKLLAKMGISLQEAGKGYMHMDMELKQSLRKRILKFAPQYNLDGLVPGEDGRRGLEGWGFVRSWGWKSTLSAVDIASVVSAILEVGTEVHAPESTSPFNQGSYQPAKSYNSRMRALPSPPHSEDDSDQAAAADPDYTTNRFFAAYDALDPIATSKMAGLNMLLTHIPTAQHLARAILRTGSALISKKQIRHLRSFRMGVVKEGPDVALFSHPGALVKLAAWVGEAVAVLEAEKGRRKNDQEALVLGCLDEGRGVYVVVGLGSGGAGKKVRSKAEIRERENKKKRKAADKAAKKAERARKRRERRELQRERDEANGLLNSDDEEENESDATESEASDSSDSDSADESDNELAQARKKRGHGLNRFGQAFQEVVEETGARVRIDSFEHSVVEVRKEDLAGFLEALSLRSVVG